MHAKCIMAACVSIRDCRGRSGKGGKERASVEGAVQVPMSIQYKIILCEKPIGLVSSSKRIHVCVGKSDSSEGV